MTDANYMQKVFDILASSPDLLTVDELAARMHVDNDVVRNAIDRLQRMRKITSAYDSKRKARYTVRPSAIRPHDQRGRRKEREAA